MGHLSRAKKVLSALNINRFKVITASEQEAHYLFSPEQLIILPAQWSRAPLKVMAHLETILPQENITQVLIDTFPCGIMGELNIDAIKQQCECHYVARYLKWDVYKNALPKQLSPARFNSTYIVDQLHPEQKHYIDLYSETAAPLVISHKQQGSTLPDLFMSQDKDRWLIVHSGPKTEVLELLAYAKDIAAIEAISPHYYLCTKALLDLPDDEVSLINHHPASDLFKQVQRIFSACGFNIMQETEAFHKKHHFIPFERKYDDQFMRAAKRRRQSGVSVSKPL